MTDFPGILRRSNKLGTPYKLAECQKKWLATYFPTTADHELAKAMGCSYISVRRIAKKLGLRKDRITICKKAMEEVLRTERMRQKMELPPMTNYYLARRKYTMAEIVRRYRAVHFWGYVLDEDFKGQNRYVIFYDENTRRNKRFEDNSIKAGFTIKNWYK